MCRKIQVVQFKTKIIYFMKIVFQKGKTKEKVARKDENVQNVPNPN